MKKTIAAKELCAKLNVLQGEIAVFQQGGSQFLFDSSYPNYYKEIELVRDGLEGFGLYKEVFEAVSRSEELARAGNYDEAEELVLTVNRKLSEVSGYNDDLRRLYRSSK